MTLKEISDKVGVSVSTVSRVISDENFGTQAVRDKVWNVIRQTGYVPNSSAQKLRKGETTTERVKTIICLYGRVKNPIENPYFEHVARAVEQQAMQRGYVTTSAFSILDMQNANVVEKILSLKPDGIVLLGPVNTQLRDLIKKNFRNVCYTGQTVFFDKWDQVICDGYFAAQSAVNHLLELGHRRIAYIGATTNESHYTSYCETLKATGIEYDPSLIGKCEQTSDGGYKGAGILLESAADNLPTAIFCSNDITAIGVIKKITECKFKVPKDFSIVSVDNINLSQYVRPMLTTVNIPMDEIGRLTANVLIDRIERGHKLPIKSVLPSNLIIRESTQSIKK